MAIAKREKIARVSFIVKELKEWLLRGNRSWAFLVESRPATKERLFSQDVRRELRRRLKN